MYNKGKRREANELKFFWGMVLTILCLTFAITALADEPAEDTEEAVSSEEVELEAEVEEKVAEGPLGPIVVTTAAEIIEVDAIETETEPELVVQKESIFVAPTEEITAVSAVSISDSDYDLLCKIVEAEATGQAVEGKMYVAAVILNRKDSSEFPDTIHGVVYQKSQFTPVYDGRINCTPTAATIEAVDRVLAGETRADGALFFMNPDISSKKNVDWFRSHLTYLFSYGGHEFYK